MPLLINGIDTIARVFPPFRNVPVARGVTTVLCKPYTHSVLGAPIQAHSGETIEGQKIRRVRQAIYHIVNRISRYEPANRAFAGLPRGQTLRAFLSSETVVICHDPINMDVQAASMILPPRADMRLSITRDGFSGTGREVEATILHELAHICGATHTHTRGGQFGAEQILRAARMGDQYMP